MLSSRLNLWNMLLNHGLKTPRKTDPTLSNQTVATSKCHHGQKLLLYRTRCCRLLLDFHYMRNLHCQVIVPSRILSQLHLASQTGLSVLPNLLLGIKHPAKRLWERLLPIESLWIYPNAILSSLRKEKKVCQVSGTPLPMVSVVGHLSEKGSIPPAISESIPYNITATLLEDLINRVKDVQYFEIENHPGLKIRTGSSSKNINWTPITVSESPIAHRTRSHNNHMYLAWLPANLLVVHQQHTALFFLDFFK